MCVRERCHRSALEQAFHSVSLALIDYYYSERWVGNCRQRGVTRLLTSDIPVDAEYMTLS